MKIRKVCLAVLMGALLLTGCGDTVEPVKEDVAESSGEVVEASEEAKGSEGVVSDEEFFKKLYDAMASDMFFEMMIELINTEDVEAIVTGVNGEPCVYSSEAGFVADYTGTAVGIYPYGEGEYYFYFGEYVDGSRTGQNKYFYASDEAIYVFEGNWENDKPNGEGSLTQYTRGEDGSYAQTYMCSKIGNFTDGIEDGEFSCTIINLQDYTILAGSYTATAGVASDVWEQYPQYHEREGFKAAHESGERIIVVCADESEENIMWLSQTDPEEELGIPGF